MRRLRPLLLVATLLTGCDLPTRDNPNDSNIRPEIAMRLLADGAPATSGFRGQVLTVDLTGTSVASGSITNIRIERLDPRGEDGGTAACPYREPVEIASLSSPGAVAFDVDTGDFCFEDDGDGNGRFVMPVRIRATVRTSRGGNESETADFDLVNALPVTDPGPTLWLDPMWGSIATFDNRRSGDFDGDVITHEWIQIAGPPVGVPTNTTEPTFTVDLSGSDGTSGIRAGAAFRFRVTSCDPWQCGSPEVFDAVLRPAVWAATGNGMMLLDGTFTTASQFDDDATTTPVSLTANSVFAPANDGLFTFVQGSTTVRHIRGDFTAVALPALPDIFQDLVGTSTYGVAWVTIGSNPGPYFIYEIGPGETATLLDTGFSQTMVTRTFVSRYDENSALWAVGYEVADFGMGVTGHFRMRVFPTEGAPQELNIFSGDPLYDDCLGDSEVDTIAADPDGGVWVVGEYGILRLTANATVVDCWPVDEAVRRFAFAVPAPEGGTRLMYVRYPTIPFLEGFELRTMSMTGVDSLASDISAGQIAFDREQNRIVILSLDGIGSYDVLGNFDVPIAFIPIGQVYPNYSIEFDQSIDLYLDTAGRPWAFYDDANTAFYLARLPEQLSLVRAVIDAAPSADLSGQASVDPRTGQVWVAEKDTASGGWFASPFDERGPIDSIAPVPLPSEEVTGFPVLSGVKWIRYDPGDVATSREAGIWVQYLATPAGGGGPAEFRIARVALDGTVVASFGGASEEPAGGFPFESSAMLYGVSATLDPTDGAVWLSVHDDNGADARLGEAYRLGADGSVTRLSTISTLREAHATTVANPGGYFATAGNTLHIVRATTGGMTSTPGCFSGDEAGSVAYDAGTGDTLLMCWDADGTGEPAYMTRWDLSTGFVLTGIPTPDTPFPTELLGELDGRVDPITGGYWAPDTTGVRIYDRLLNDTGVYPVPGNIRFMVH